jgi:hypothetical protein
LIIASPLALSLLLMGLYGGFRKWKIKKIYT